jgi:DNA-binding LacI/PurR family transcriptional regulator
VLALCCGVLLQVRRKLMNTRRRMEEMLQGNVDGIIASEHSEDWYASEEELAQPLLAVYW